MRTELSPQGLAVFNRFNMRLEGIRIPYLESQGLPHKSGHLFANQPLCLSAQNATPTSR